MRPMSRTGEQGEEGFTLLELLVVLVLAGLLTAAVSFAFPAIRTVSLDKIASQLVSELRTVRNTAILIDEAVDFEISVDGRAFRTPQGEGSLPKDIELTVTSARELGNDDWSVVRFYPEGASSGGTVAVMRGDERVKIVVNWLTSRIERVRK